MQQEGHPWDSKFYSKHANRHLDKELLGTLTDGQYVDMHNMRQNSMDGDSSSAKKIGGEVVNHPKNNVPGSFFSIGEAFVKERKVEFWVDKYGVEAPIIRIDGLIVAQSPRIPFLKGFPLQLSKNESCVGGEVFVTDNNSPPMYFNVEDMISSLTTDPEKYFLNFNPDLYTVNLNAPLDIPVFVELVNMGGGGGLPVGTYQYALRYSNKSGDRTNRGPLTPIIPVVANLSPGSKHYPYSKTTAGPSNIQFPTSYGVKLKFRVTNINDYDFIEVIRIAYNKNAGPNYTPETTVIARVDIVPQQYSIVEFIDPVASNVTEVITDTEDANQMHYIERAKAIRYYDSRVLLMNFKVASKATELEFSETDGKVAFPVVHKMGLPGHSDPYNFAYYKHYMGGERYGFAVQTYDPAGGKSFTQDIPGFENYQYPNRRDQMDATSQLYSYFGYTTAADVVSAIGPTFEVFDHESAIAKNDICTFKNIHKKGDKANGSGNANQTEFYCSIDPEQFGAKERLGRVRAPYAPYGPTDKNDPNDSSGYIVNPEVHNGSDWVNFRPQGFGLNYFAHGMAVSGITNFPKWAKSFSIVRTQPAGRVVMQGLGCYSFNPGDFDLIGNKALVTKRGNKLWFYSPDYDSNMVSVDLVNDMIANPNNYTIQLVSPLGFFSEVYGFEANTVNQRRSRIVDMVTYARVLRDNGQINPGESGVGVGSYVAYNKYRNSNAAGGGAFASSDGNKSFGLNSVAKIIEGRNNFIELELNETLYNEYGTGGAANSDFEDQELKDWTEPFYIVNIIREGRNVQDKNTKEFLSTGHYQKLESIIGVGTGSAGLELDLVDERWEDSIPDLSSSGPFASRDTFVYIRPNNMPEQTWMNVTFKTPAQVIAIINDINVNGFYQPSPGIEVTGLYTHTNSNNRNFSIVFNSSYTVPDRAKVVVKYDASMPIQVFGGDATIGEVTWSPIDKQSDGENSDDKRDNQFAFNNGFPFRQWRINPRHYVIRDSAAAVNQIQNETDAHLGYLRQMAMMFTCENRSAACYAYSSGTGVSSQFFPNTHYVIRPNRWSTTAFGTNSGSDIAADNKMHVDYFVDYPSEWNFWNYGGFRIGMTFNLDFAKQSPIDHFGKPEIGFEEETEFCTGIAASLTRPVNVQDAPGLKTFLTSNTYYTVDDSGEIKFAYSARTGGKGENVYAICEKGIVLLLTKKTILSNLNADELSATSTDSFFNGEYWITRDLGCNDEMWRSKAEANAVYPSESGDIRLDTLFFANKHSVFRLSENIVKEIGKLHYYERLNPALSVIKPGYRDHVTATYNEKNDEYWLQLTYEEHCDCCPETTQLFVFSQKNNGWTGTFSYKFDQYISAGRTMYGCRDLTTYRLDEGFKINGENIEAYVIQASAVKHIPEKEFIRIRVNSDNKPVRIDFLDTEFNVVAKMDQATYGPHYLKKYDGWEQFIPRQAQVYNFNKNRIQNRLLIYRIIHNLAENFKVVSTNVQYKDIK